LTATNGFDGYTKCSWFVKVDKGTHGPTVKIASADFSSFTFFWLEYISTMALDTGALLPPAEGANWFIGNYAATDGDFLNPLDTVATEDTTFKRNQLAFFSGTSNRNP